MCLATECCSHTVRLSNTSLLRCFARPCTSTGGSVLARGRPQLWCHSSAMRRSYAHEAVVVAVVASVAVLLTSAADASVTDASPVAARGAPAPAQTPKGCRSDVECGDKRWCDVSNTTCVAMKNCSCTSTPPPCSAASKVTVIRGSGSNTDCLRGCGCRAKSDSAATSLRHALGMVRADTMTCDTKRCIIPTYPCESGFFPAGYSCANLL